MKSWKSIGFAGAAAIACLAGFAARAADAPLPPAYTEVADCTANDVETADLALLTSTEDDGTNGGGFDMLKQRLPQLEAALAHAPARLNRMELCGDKLVVYVDGPADAAAGLIMAQVVMSHPDVLAKGLHGRPAPKSAVAVRSPYVFLSFYVGTTYNELHQFDRAIPALEKGLALAPNNPILVNEASMALIYLRRVPEAVDLCDRALASGAPMADRDRARLYRTRGFALGELKRYGDAKASYEVSLKYDPGNGGALNEIRYYEGLIAGAPPTPVEMTTSDKFRKKDAPPPEDPKP
jgi:tetratricopeptide (TPR) repeat protein